MAVSLALAVPPMRPERPVSMVSKNASEAGPWIDVCRFISLPAVLLVFTKL